MGASEVFANKKSEDSQITVPATTMLITACAAYLEIWRRSCRALALKVQSVFQK